MKIKQGDSYDIEITLTDDDGTLITPELVQTVEVTLGNLTKTYPDGDLTYDGVWVFPLIQEETRKLSGIRALESRVKFTDETVAGASVGVVSILPAQSKVVL